VAVAPSVSYSITVRLEVPSRGRAVSELTHAVEHAGGAVTALDVTPHGHERLRIDVTCASVFHPDVASAVAAAVRDAAGGRPSRS
jgi:malate dehydrogenase (oxaloacetate-decarboxylating)